ncbi:MAG: nuclear transport factor 2 family protein [Bacteroidales bacterium]|nr:nuclear transport factor 2 family protein [Bacteroidales bacterium]
MKKHLIALSILLIGLYSCKSDNSYQKTDPAVLEKEVLAALEQFKTGIINADRNILEDIFADKLVYGHSSGKVQNKSECIDEIVSLQPNDYLTIDMTEQTITISREIAIVRHIYSSEFTSNGTPGNLRIGNVLIWQKQEGKWKLIARQAYRLS